MSEQRLTGKTILLTGAGSGLGRAMALGLLEEGARVVCTDANEAGLTETRSLAPAADDALFVAADITAPAERDRLLDAASARFGPVDVLINCAGIAGQVLRPDFFENPILFWEIEEKAMRRFFDVNSIAPQMLALSVVRGMMERGWGRIVNVTTSLDTMLKRGFSGYGGSKAALEAHTAIMALDLQGTGVTANVLVPGGPADTPMIPKTTNVDRSKMIRPEQMVPPAVWLSSPESDGVTGRRFVAALWDASLPVPQAAEQAGAPVAWTGVGIQARYPD